MRAPFFPARLLTFWFSFKPPPPNPKSMKRALEKEGLAKEAQEFDFFMTTHHMS